MKTSKMPDAAQLTKQFYTIGEVSEMFDVSVEVLRKWEKDFPNKIRPMRTKGDTRLYHKRDIEQIQMIYRLRYTEGKTIAGVRRTLHSNPGQEEVKQEVIGHLRSIRSQLQSVVDEFDALLDKNQEVPSIEA